MPNIKTMYLYLVASLLACAALAFMVYHLPYGESQATLKDATITLLINLVSTILLIVLGVSRATETVSRVVAHEIQKAKLGSVAQFWDIPSKEKEWIVIFGGSFSDCPACGQPGYDPDKALPRPTITTVYAYSEISKCIRTILGDYDKQITFLNIRCMSAKDWDRFPTSNVIFLGGICSLPGVADEIMEQSRLGVKQIVSKDERQFSVDNAKLNFHQEKLKAKIEGSKIKKDYCLVLRSISTHSSLFLFDGNYGATTLAGVRTFSTSFSDDTIQEIPDRKCVGTIVKSLDLEAENPDFNKQACRIVDRWVSSDFVADRHFYNELRPAFEELVKRKPTNEGQAC